ncbi:hypothetical protein ABBQ32_013743 [Trebouxia sp. C0010 RCD-2024]
MGLGLIIIAGAELLTANSCYLSAAVFEGKAKPLHMVYHMFFCFWGNLAGSLILVGLVYGTQLFHAEPAITTAAVYTVEYVEIKCTAGFGHVVARAFLCNWLVCLACYQATAAQDVLGKLAAIFFPVMAFVAVGYDHAVANMFIIPFGMMLGAPVTVGHYIVYSLIPTMIGNMTASIVMISFTYSMCYGTLPARIQKHVPLFAKVFGPVSQGASHESNMRDDSAHNRI